MGALGTLIIIISVAFLLILWVVVGFRHLGYLQKAVREQWEKVNLSLRKRQDLLPNLIETVRAYEPESEELLEKLIGERIKAAKEKHSGRKKIEYEHDLTMSINEVLSLEKKNEELGKDTNFLELRKNISDVSMDMEERANKYNQMVRQYNKSRTGIVMRPVSAIFGFKVLNIFEVEV